MNADQLAQHFNDAPGANARFSCNSRCPCAHIKAIEQLIELPAAHRHRVAFGHPRPDKTLSLEALRPQHEVVFIKPLFRMSLIDRENTVWNALSWGVPPQNAPAP
jgi:hypothetical protein